MFKHDQEAIREGGETIIAQGVKVDGDFASDGKVIIAGEVNGSVKTAGRLEIQTSAKIKADVSAGEAVVAGEVNGNIVVAGKLDLLESSVISGDITAEVLSIVSGAKINGHISMNNRNSKEATV